MFRIWRERITEPGTYDRTGRFDFGECGDGDQPTLVAGTSIVYECTLSRALSFEPGDFIGIQLPPESDARVHPFLQR